MTNLSYSTLTFFGFALSGSPFLYLPYNRQEQDVASMNRRGRSWDEARQWAKVHQIGELSVEGITEISGSSSW